MLSRSMENFKTKDQFKLDEFTEEVIHQPEVVQAFNEYRQTYQNAKEFNIDDEFDIHLSAVKTQERFYKAVLKLEEFSHLHTRSKGFD